MPIIVVYLSRKEGSKEQFAKAASLVVAVITNLRARLDALALRVKLRLVA